MAMSWYGAANRVCFITAFNRLKKGIIPPRGLFATISLSVIPETAIKIRIILDVTPEPFTLLAVLAVRNGLYATSSSGLAAVPLAFYCCDGTEPVERRAGHWPDRFH
jgi:hypothetical protein